MSDSNITKLALSNALKDLLDPEFMAKGDNIYNGGQLGAYPTQRSYTLGVTLTL